MREEVLGGRVSSAGAGSLCQRGSLWEFSSTEPQVCTNRGKKEINECLVCVWACGNGLHFLSFCLFIDSQTTNSFNQ